jgi:hypothetical protein
MLIAQVRSTFLIICIQFDELILSVLVRPEIAYTRNDLRAAFEITAGKGGENGEIFSERLTRAIHLGAGGLDPIVVGDIMAMLDGNIGGIIDYDEIIDLMMGVEDPVAQLKEERKKVNNKKAAKRSNAH